MELVLFFICVAVVILYCVFKGVYDDRKRKKLYARHLRQDYGQYEVRQYTTEQMQTMARLYRRQVQENTFAIDDTTWNDLNMDKIFAQINHTQSSAGGEYLYNMLRRPAMQANRTEILERHIQYLTEQEKERIRLQILLHELGSTGRYSLYDYLDFMDSLGKRDNMRHIFAIAAFLLSVVIIGFSTTTGVIALITISCINIATYMKEKNTVLPYLTSFSYIMRMLICADKIVQEPFQDMQDYKTELAEKAKLLVPMRKSGRIVFKMNASSGNPIEIVFDYIKMLTHVDIIQFNRMLNLVRKNEDKITQLAQDIGYLDTVIAIGAFRKSLPYWCIPVLEDGAQMDFSIKNGYHPTLKDAVPNGFCQQRGILITGSNASGKSTFLKMTAINAVLAQTIHTCTAESYSGNCYRIYSSMALRDDLEQGESYYIVEIKSLKRIIDAANEMNSNPLLCFVDEVLRGTNTVERIAASAQILHQLAKNDVYCFAATHDIELTHLLEMDYDNYHFEEEISNGDVTFSYHLLPGRAQSRNAIKLLELIGFSQDITTRAQTMAEHFINSGQWEDSYVC